LPASTTIEWQQKGDRVERSIARHKALATRLVARERSLLASALARIDQSLAAL
jgi:hypothetical protein